MLANAPTRDADDTEYSRAEVRRFLNVPERQLKAWERMGFVTPAITFGFKELISLRALKQLSDKRIPGKQIALAIESLKQKLTGVEQPLNELRIVSDGKTIAVQVAGQKMEAITGQLVFDFDASELPAVRTMGTKVIPRQMLEDQAEAYFQQGLHLEETGAPPDQALAAYQKAVELNPEAAGALVNLGTIAFRAKRLREAAAYYERAIKADPQYPLAHFNLGNVFDELGKTDSAREQYQFAVRLNPDYADAHFNLALIAERDGDNLRALKHWKAYLKLDGTSTWAVQARKQIERLRRLTVVE